MYVVKNWNEEVIKWLAIAMCLAMVGMAVMPIITGDLAYYVVFSSKDPAIKATAAVEAVIGSILIKEYMGLILAGTALGPLGWVGFGCAILGTW